MHLNRCSVFFGYVDFKNIVKPEFAGMDYPADDERLIRWNDQQTEFTCFSDSLNSISRTSVYSDVRNRLTITGEIRLYNQPELQQQLETDSTDNHELFLKAYTKWGQDFPSKINGDFSFAIWDEPKKILFCGRDPLGQKPFYYSMNDDRFFFASNFKIVHKNTPQATNADLNRDWLIYFLVAKYNGKTETIFHSIKRLEPGHTLVIQNKTVSITRYWNIDKASHLQVSDPSEAVKGLITEIQRAVEVRMEGASQVGSELSGGLDSSLVAAIAQECSLKHQIASDAYTNIMAPEDKLKYPDFYDEWDKAAKVAAHIKIKNHIPVQKVIAPPVQLMDLFLDINGCPSNFHFSILQKGIYKEARERKNSVLFSGFGGDEMVSSSSFSTYLNTVYKEKGIFHLTSVFRKRKMSFFRAVYHTIRYKMGLVLKRQDAMKKKIYKDFMRRNLLKDEIINDGEYASKWYTISYFPSLQTLKERELFHLSSGGMTERLETGYQITNHVGINYSLPLLDIRLLEYYYHLPDKLKGEAKTTRFLFREVCKEYLPKEITNQLKPSNSLTMPFHKIEMYNEMKNLVDYCLSIPDSSTVFNYLDRSKFVRFVNEINYEEANNKDYKMLLRIIMLHRFFEREGL